MSNYERELALLTPLIRWLPLVERGGRWAGSDKRGPEGAARRETSPMGIAQSPGIKHGSAGEEEIGGKGGGASHGLRPSVGPAETPGTERRAASEKRGPEPATRKRPAVASAKSILQATRKITLSASCRTLRFATAGEFNDWELKLDLDRFNWAKVHHQSDDEVQGAERAF